MKIFVEQTPKGPESRKKVPNFQDFSVIWDASESDGSDKANQARFQEARKATLHQVDHQETLSAGIVFLYNS